MNSAYLKDFTYGLAGLLLKEAVFDPDSTLPTKHLTSPPAEHSASGFGDPVMDL